jgi:hypothetical protein
MHADTWPCMDGQNILKGTGEGDRNKEHLLVVHTSDPPEVNADYPVRVWVGMRQLGTNTCAFGNTGP